MSDPVEMAKKAQEVEDFFKEAMCVDGESKMIFRDAVLKSHPFIRLTDSKRGTFLVTIIKADQ